MLEKEALIRVYPITPKYLMYYNGWTQQFMK